MCAAARAPAEEGTGDGPGPADGGATTADGGATTATPAHSPEPKKPGRGGDDEGGAPVAGSGAPTPAQTPGSTPAQKPAPEKAGRRPRKTRRQGLGPYRLLQPWQKQKLEAFFKENPLPDKSAKDALAETLEMDINHLQTWLINRRTKQRRMNERANARGASGGAKPKRGANSEQPPQAPAPAPAPAAAAAALAGGGGEAGKPLRKVGSAPNHLAKLKGGPGGSGSRGATENVSPDGTTTHGGTGATTVHPAAFQAAAAAQALYAPHMNMVHAAQLAQLQPNVGQQAAVAAAAAAGAAAAIGMGGKGGEDVEVQSTHAVMPMAAMPPFLGAAAAPGAQFAAVPVPGMPGGLQYPGGVPVREWVLPPGAGAWAGPGGAAAHPAAAPEGAGLQALAGSLEAAAAAAQWGGMGGGGYAPGMAHVPSWGTLQIPYGQAAHPVPANPGMHPGAVHPGLHPGAVPAGIHPGLNHAHSAPQLAQRKLQLPQETAGAAGGAGDAHPLGPYPGVFPDEREFPRV